MAAHEIPWAQIDTVFLDAGNTLVSVDFAWVGREMAARGVHTDLPALRRAEAAARPRVSEAAARRRGTEGGDAFVFYLRSVLHNLPAAAALAEADRDALAGELAPVLRSGGSLRLWSEVMPRVPEALAALRALGLTLVVVSNSDGTVEQTLERCGLRPHLHHVLDSHHVGVEKPDPRIFHLALERARGHPARALHVGDLYAADVAGARAAGVHALLLDPYDDWEGADCERAPDLWELAERLRAARGRGPARSPAR